MSSSLAAIRERIYQVNPNWPDARLSAELRGYVDEFAEMLVPEPGNCRPLDEDEVVALQMTAITKRRMQQASELEVPINGPVTVEAFIKKETYPGPKDLRNISGVDISHN